MKISRKNIARMVVSVWLCISASSVYAALLDVADYRASVTASALNVRTGPSTNYAVAGQLGNGATVTVTHHDGNWARFYWNSRYVYAHRNYLKKQAASSPPTSGNSNVPDYRAYVTASALNVRSAPTTSSSIIGRVTKNQGVTVTHHNGVWRKISWGGRNAYVHGNYLRKSQPVTPAPTPTPGNSDINVSDYTAYVTAARLRVRSGSGTNYAIIGHRYRNQSVRVTHHSGVWRRITWSNGRRAYVHGSYLRKTNPVTSCASSITVDNLNRAALNSARNIRNQLLINITNPFSTGVGGLCASSLVGVGVGATVADCVAVDRQGNLGVAVTFAGGLVLGKEASVSGGVLVSNASRVADLRGLGYCVGLSGNLGLGADTVGCTGLKKTSNTSCIYESNGILQGVVGGGVGLGASVQAMVGNTIVGTMTWQQALRAMKKFAGTSSAVVKRYVTRMFSVIKNKVGDLGSLGTEVANAFGSLLRWLWPF